MKPLKKMGLFLFLKEFFLNPASVGSAVPSSLLLAKTIATQVPRDTSGYVVEIGPGTGVVTEALLKAGVALDKFIIIERSHSFYKHLQKRFPHVTIIHGDAMDLEKLLGDKSAHVSAIVSSLPLRSLPAATGAQIAEQMEKVLMPGGVFVQFTYSLIKTHANLPQKFKYAYSKKIWMNLPPARVDVFKHE
jgi:phospholipid N-methyltransferase